MFHYFLMVVPSMWPHAFFIVGLAWLGRRIGAMGAALAMGAAGAVVTTGLYWLLQNGIAPSHGAPVGQWIALLLAGGVPLLGAALVGTFTERRYPGGRAVLAGVIAGVLLVIPMPTMQVALGCALTGLCP